MPTFGYLLNERHWSQRTWSFRRESFWILTTIHKILDDFWWCFGWWVGGTMVGWFWLGLLFSYGSLLQRLLRSELHPLSLSLLRIDFSAEFSMESVILGWKFVLSLLRIGNKLKPRFRHHARFSVLSFCIISLSSKNWFLCWIFLGKCNLGLESRIEFVKNKK